MKLNNKGFAITTILYGVLILFLMLLVSSLGILSSYKDRMELLVESNNGARDILNGNYSESNNDNEEDSNAIAYAVYSDDDTSLTFYKTTDVIEVGNMYNGKIVTSVYTGFETDIYTSQSNVPWYNYRTNITSVIFDDKISPVSTSYWFNNFTNCSTYDFEKLNTLSVTDMSYMFYSIGGTLTNFSLDLTILDVSNVTNMSYMFGNSGRGSVTSYFLNLSGWNVSNVKNMSYMFNNAGNSTNVKTFEIVGLENWNTSNVANMAYMFGSAGMYATTWDIEGVKNWNTSNVTNMAYMFSNAGYSTPLTYTLDLSGWDVTKVTIHTNFNANSPVISPWS